MSTARTCTTPKDGWALYYHFLSNGLSVIASQQWRKKEKDEEQRNKDERVLSNTWAKLVGNLYMIMRRMQANDHYEDATKMQQLIDMTVELDLTDPTVREAIHAKNKEFDSSLNRFEAMVEKLNAEHAK
ncbi:MAG: hypothetical protein HQ537_00500 [Parcubacteria group bacterium]|nr:hypothetical protein [Parcubacteria group bacterium]